MKKSLIVSIGVILILLVLCVWLYLLFFGTPKDGGDVFTNLGFEVTTPAPATTTTALEATLPATDVALATLGTGKALQQLTTRPVAGFGFVGTSSDRIRYVERGTGHIYEIDTAAGTEIRVSGTTIPQVVEAAFSPSGEQVALTAEISDTHTIYAGLINAEQEKADYLELPSGASQPALVEDGDVRYILKTNIGTEGYRLNIDTKESVRIFSIPLRDITVLWGEETYLYNKPTRYAEGTLYKIDNGLKPVLPTHFGFVGGLTDSYYLTNYNEGGVMASYAKNKESGEAVRLATSFVPEKCAASADTRVWCAAPYTSHDGAFLEGWYRGSVQSADILWIVDISRGQAQSMANFLVDAGRQVDVDHIIVDSSGQVPAFRNKIDNTLWIYDSRK